MGAGSLVSQFTNMTSTGTCSTCIHAVPCHVHGKALHSANTCGTGIMARHHPTDPDLGLHMRAYVSHGPRAGILCKMETIAIATCSLETIATCSWETTVRLTSMSTLSLLGTPYASASCWGHRCQDLETND